MHQSHPRLRYRLMITSLQIVDGRTPRYRQTLESRANFCDRTVQRMLAQVEVGDLDVVTMMEFVKCARFKRGEEFVVGHRLSELMERVPQIRRHGSGH